MFDLDKEFNFKTFLFENIISYKKTKSAFKQITIIIAYKNIPKCINY